MFVAIGEQILLYMLAAPLLLFGIPDWMLRPLLTKPRIRGVARILSIPSPDSRSCSRGFTFRSSAT